jgi:hypothetical protein
MTCTNCSSSTTALTFGCSTSSCNYGLCFYCVTNAFPDCSGDRIVNCPICRNDTVLPMIESVFGKGAIEEVERVLRSKIELEVYSSRLLDTNTTMDHTNVKVSAAVDQSTKCPRCSTIVHNYTNFNAICCSNVSCRIIFCGGCLKDCGNYFNTNSHSHVNKNDMTFSEATKKEGEDNTLKRKYSCLSKNELNQNVLDGNTIRDFISVCKNNLDYMIKVDRLSILNVIDIDNGGICLDNVSPRNKIPTEYRLFMIPTSGNRVTIELFQLRLDGTWKKIPLPDDKKSY